MKPFTTIAIAFLAFICIAQTLRLCLGWEVTVNGMAIPLGASGVAAVITGGLSFLLWRESRGK
jgi:hypothetical protein